MENAPGEVARRRRFQFRLRTLLIVLTLVALVLGYEAHRVRQQRQAIAALRQSGPANGIEYSNSGKSWPAPFRILRAWMGDDWFAHVKAIQLTEITDEDLAPLAQLPDLEGLDIESSRLTDAGLRLLPKLRSLRIFGLTAPQLTDAGIGHLSQCQGLELLVLTNTQVTPEGVHKLQAALPRCKISSGPDYFEE